MILLLGGTSDAGPIAARLAAVGHRVLVSQATDVPLEVPEHARIERRAGPLDAAALAELVWGRGIRAIVDAGHPYAAELHATAARVAGELGVPYFAFVRPGVCVAESDGVRLAADHATAAREAFADGRPVLLTVGSKNLAPYAEEARRTGIPLVVRVLDRPQSRAACRAAGIPGERVLAGRGPFSVEENRRQIERFGIGVVVTKDSGQAGGTAEKLQAAREAGCLAIVVRRPERDVAQACADVDELLRRMEATPLSREKKSGGDG